MRPGEELIGRRRRMKEKRKKRQEEAELPGMRDGQEVRFGKRR